MIQNTKCECGHQNHVGTVLCESCGKPLFEDGGNELLEMRYDGVARRSQRQDKSFIDQIWSFFSSVKVAIYLIFITLCGAAIGTIYPQENVLLNVDPQQFYQNYGTLGKIYYTLGFSHTFNSWWFLLLLFMIGTSLVICSLDRVLPLYRALNKQQIQKHLQFILRQRISYQGTLPINDETEFSTQLKKISDYLKRRKYRTKVDLEKRALLAEKYRFSRWGPYINHIGLIVFLCGALMRSIPGWYMDQYVSFLEGVPVPIPQTQYYLKNEKFTIETYTENDLKEAVDKASIGTPKLYQTKAVLYKCVQFCNDSSRKPQLQPLTEQNIEVNQPLKYQELKIYRFNYKYTPLIISEKVTLTNPSTGKDIGQFTLDMLNPMESYEAGSYHFNVSQYYPDFALDKDGHPSSKSGDSKAPVFIFNVTGPDLPKEGSVFMFFVRPIDKQQYEQDKINQKLGSHFQLAAKSMNDIQIATYTSYLNIRIDKAMPIIWVGAAISMIGLILGFYWQHRRIWIRLDGGQLSLGAHTNKNWFGIRKEVTEMLNHIGLEVESRAIDKGGSKK